MHFCCHLDFFWLFADISYIILNALIVYFIKVISHIWIYILVIKYEAAVISVWIFHY